MKIYDFDKVIDRRGSGAVKTDALKNVYGSEDLVPLWVADMDFATPDFIKGGRNYHSPKMFRLRGIAAMQPSSRRPISWEIV